MQFLTAAALPANTFTAGTPGATVDKITMTANGQLAVDGQNVAVNDTVYVKDEATASHNGVYTVTVKGDGSTQAVLSRTNASQSIGDDLSPFPLGNTNGLSRWTFSAVATLNQGCYSSGTYTFQATIPGGNTVTYGLNQVNFGRDNTLSAHDAVTVGIGCTASGIGSASLGQGCVASGFQAVAVGYQVNNAQGQSAEFGYAEHKIHLGTDKVDGGNGLINGYVLSNNGGSPNTQIDIGAGTATDSTGLVFMTDAGKTKDISVAWTTGTGGLFSGSVAASTVYHVFIIRKDSDGSFEYGFDTSVTAANKPAGYTYYRRLGSVITDGSSHIRAFHQYGDEFYWDTTIKDVDVTNPGTSAVTRTLTVPTGVKVCAIFTSVSWDSTQNTQHICSSLDAADEAPSYANAIEVASSNTTNEAVGNNRIWTNTSGQVRSRLAQSGANTAFKVRTRGWVDPRGK